MILRCHVLNSTGNNIYVQIAFAALSCVAAPARSYPNETHADDSESDAIAPMDVPSYVELDLTFKPPQCNLRKLKTTGVTCSLQLRRPSAHSIIVRICIL